MLVGRSILSSLLLFFVIYLPFSAGAQSAPEPLSNAANAFPTYRALRSITLSGESVAVKELALKRDIGTFNFNSGVFYFLTPVEGKVTGAVFVGEATLHLNPTVPSERARLAAFSKSPQFSESFGTAVFRFTDGTYDELKKFGAATPDGGTAAKALASNLDLLQNDKMMRYNLSARILQDVLAGSSGLFYAFIRGNTYGQRELFAVDPHGLRMLGVEPEEVAFALFEGTRRVVVLSNHLEDEYRNGSAKGTQSNSPFVVSSQNLDTSIDKSGGLRGTATTTIAATGAGLRVLSFDLFPRFQVDSVTAADGQPLPFIMEGRSMLARDDPSDPDNFSVILPKPLAAGETATIVTRYAGKGAILNEGEGNYFLVARDDWYPSARMGQYNKYQMKFSIPKGLKLTATATLLHESTQGDQAVSEWSSDVPMQMAGFNLGRFKVIDQKLPDGSVVQSFANEGSPDFLRAVLQSQDDVLSDSTLPSERGGSNVALGNMSTLAMMKEPLAEAAVAEQIYSDYFGDIAYKRIAMTQQPACNFGQSWPQLVWLPICAFFDETVRHEIHIDDTRQPYWDVVTAHEAAHQWWGQTVGFQSYRDQWISEGFAQTSASIFLQAAYPKQPERFRTFWQKLQADLVYKDGIHIRPIDAGTVTTGFRLGSYYYRSLAYSKGAYILHMLRMMMWDPQTRDQTFKEMMHDFAKTYANQAASTEDFKAIVEKHMLPEMDLDHNHTMDWFFNEYVYGTELPRYDISGTVENDANGYVIDLQFAQSGVHDGFKMIVPIYLELQSGNVVRMIATVARGNTSFENKLRVGKMQDPPRRVMANYYYDVLCEP